ncbi:MAG TPA: calcium-binding protein [Actinomycetota bacterium]|nr:calcium-binding protein [Actinomycetota bacterium]
MTAGKRDLDALIEEITVDCYGEDEELTGFLAYFEDALERPVEATVVGVPVTIVGVDCPAGALRGLVARCRRGGADYEVSLRDVALPRGSELARILAAYRYWAGVEPWSAGVTRPRGAGGGAAARR